MSVRMRLLIQADEISFLRMFGFSLRDRVRSSVIGGKLGVEPLLHHIERSLLKWFGYLVRLPPGATFPLQLFLSRPSGKRLSGTPRTLWRDFISHQSWKSLKISQEDPESAAGDCVGKRRVCLLPP